MPFARVFDADDARDVDILPFQYTIQSGRNLTQLHSNLPLVNGTLCPLMSEHRHLLKSASTISTLTILSRVFGYVRDSRIAFLLGTGDSADAFTLAFRIPNLLRRLVGEGAVNAAVVPVFTAYLMENRKEEAWDLVNRLITILTVLMTTVAVLGIVLSPFLTKLFATGFESTPGKMELTALLNRIMFPYIALISIAALSMGVLNSLHRFTVPAF